VVATNILLSKECCAGIWQQVSKAFDEAARFFAFLYSWTLSASQDEAVMLTADNEVHFGAVGSAADTFQYELSCKLPVAEAVAILHSSIVDAGLWVLHEIDVQALLKRGGYAVAALHQILFFHPRFMARLLAADPAALLEVPLKFALRETAGGRVVLRWTDPAIAFSRYENPALTDLGLELSAICEEIAAAAFLSPNPTNGKGSGMLR
jgi:uncharacterized protein (DUF302 family)